MATIKQFKQEIANLVKAQKAAKNINDCSSVYYNRGRLDLVNKDYSSFYEPDLGNQLTAIALQDDGRMFKKLKLVRE